MIRQHIDHVTAELDVGKCYKKWRMLAPMAHAAQSFFLALSAAPHAWLAATANKAHTCAESTHRSDRRFW